MARSAIHYTRVGILLLALVGSILFGCMQQQSSMQVAKHNSVSSSTLKHVDIAFKEQFLGGNWHYQGAEATRGTINAYIQIPQRLEMSMSQQKDYLQRAICPSVKYNTMWRSVDQTPLSVHLYTFNKRFTVFADCKNPLV